MQKITVVGAGACGLSTARMLLAKGYDVTVLEARDRIGGRIHTIHSKFSRHVEAGPEFIHGDLPLTLDLINEAKLEKTLIDGNFYSISNNELEEGNLLYEYLSQLLPELNKLDRDVTLAAFLDQRFGGDAYAELRKRIIQYAEGFDIADVNRVSSLALRQEWSSNDDEHQYHIQAGYSALIDFLREKIIATGGSIELNQVVQKIDWKEDSVCVQTEGSKTFECEKLIITVPLGVLQKESITFYPPLTEHKFAFQQMGFGGVIKFHFEFKEVFWESEAFRKLNDMAFVFSDAEIPTWWSQLPDQTPVLTGWYSGPKTFDVNHSQESLYQKAIESLCYIFRCSSTELESFIVQYNISDWTQDRFSYGAYSYPTTQSSSARKILLQPVKDTLYFAGEALYEGPAMGTVEAALTSAKQVAENF